MIINENCYKLYIHFYNVIRFIDMTTRKISSIIPLWYTIKPMKAGRKYAGKKIFAKA